MMSLICFQPPESSGNSQTTTGGGNHDVTLDYIVNDLLSFFKGFKCLNETKKEIEDTCDIKKEHGGCWSADDIKQVWKETQIMDIKSSRRRHWARVIMLQVLKRCLCYDGFKRIEAQSDLKKVETSEEITPSETEQVPSQIPSSSETRDNMDTKATQKDDSNTITTIKEEECLEHLDQSLAELSVSNKGNVKEQTMKENPPGGENKVMVQPHSEFSFQTPTTKRRQPDSQDVDTFERNNKEQYKRKKEKLEKMEDGSWKRGLNQSSSQTVYIRIPLSVMSGNELTCVPEEDAIIKNSSSTYKLIDRVPNLTELRKKKSYVMLYDNQTRNAAWVYEILNESTLKNNVSNSSKSYEVDDSIHPFFQTPSVKKTEKNKYHNGHLAAAANHRWCEKANEDTYVLSNITLQNQNLNQSQWSSLENYCRNKCTDDRNIRNVHVYTGPLYLPKDPLSEDSNVKYLMRKGKAVPTHFFKVVIEEKHDDTVELESYLMPNEQLTQEMEYYKKSINYIEQVSGLIFTESLCNQEKRDSMKTVIWKGENKYEEPCDAQANVRVSTVI